MDNVEKPRPPMRHHLKTWPEQYEKVLTEEKPFEIRKADRDFRVGDTLYLEEWRPTGFNKGDYTGRKCIRVITHVLQGGQFGIEKGYCALGIQPLNWRGK